MNPDFIVPTGPEPASPGPHFPGSIRLYPGIELCFPAFQGQETFCFSHPPLKSILEINYCLAGRIGWHMANGSQIYLGPGDFSLHTLDVCAQSSITLPNGSYQGISLRVNLQQLDQAPPAPLAGSGVTGRALYEKFCPNGSCTALAGDEHIQQIFSGLYQAPEPLRTAYQKVKVLELLLVLHELETGTHLTQYRCEQVQIIRQIHDQLTGNLDQRLSIAELAKQHLMNPTTLKQMFKSIYGNSIAAHIREHRMEAAAQMLLRSDATIGEIAARVGYDSQSRFSAAFKNHFQMLPKEYRQQFWDKNDPFPGV